MKNSFFKVIVFLLLVFLSVLLFQNYLLKKENEKACEAANVRKKTCS